MSEFNSAACGGIPGISDTFAVGSLWTTDYVLQMAAAGYSGIYMHTREQGIPYNPFDPPANGGGGAWSTNPTFYAYLAVGEALQSQNGSIVVDLNIANSMVDVSATVAGYAIYDAHVPSVRRVVLFNFANGPSAATQFTLPANIFTAGTSKNVTVKYLSAASSTEKYNISWGGQTLAGVGDGVLVSSPSGSEAWSTPNQNIDCVSGCQVNVPAPGMAVVFVGDVQDNANPTSSSSPTSSSHPASGTNLASNAPGNVPPMEILTTFIATFILWKLMPYS